MGGREQHYCGICCAVANYDNSSEILENYPNESFDVLVRDGSLAFEYIKEGRVFGKAVSGCFDPETLPFISNELIVPLKSVSATIGSYYFTSEENTEELFQNVISTGYSVVPLTTSVSTWQKFRGLLKNMIFDAVVLVLIGTTGGIFLFDVQTASQEGNTQWVRYLCGQTVYNLLLTECASVFDESLVSLVLWFSLLRLCSIYSDNALFTIAITTVLIVSVLRILIRLIVGIVVINSRLKGEIV